MTRGIPAQELLADMAKRLKAEGAVNVTLTVQPRQRRRKNRWHTAKGRVVGVRFTDTEYELLERTAKASGYHQAAI